MKIDRIFEIQKERDRWYGAAQERQIENNALLAQLARVDDVEGLAQVLHKLHPFCSYPSARLIKEWDALSAQEKVPYLREATAVSAWLKEGK